MSFHVRDLLKRARSAPGTVSALDPATGGVIWSQRIGAVGSLARLVDAGDIDVHEAAKRFAVGDFPDFEVDASPLDSVHLPPLFATVEGTRDGVHLRRSGIVLALPPTGMGGATGVPAAVGLRCLLADRPNPGVHTAEQVIDPVRFFAALVNGSARCRCTPRCRRRRRAPTTRARTRRSRAARPQ